MTPLILAIRERLKSILAPDGKTPLSESGLVSEIVIRDKCAYFSLMADPNRLPLFEAIAHAAQEAAKTVKGIDRAVVSLTHEKSEDPSTKRPAPQPIPGVRAIVAVASGKGGVGKSTLACSLALALSQKNMKVGLLDCDVYGPSIPTLLGLTGQPEVLPGRILKPLEKYGLKVMSMGFLIHEDAPLVWRGLMVMSAVKQMLHQVAWNDLDVLIVDMPPGTGDAALTLVQTVPLTGAVIISTPQDLALLDARRAVAMFQKVDVPILGIVENMSTFVCPSCGTASPIFAHGGAREEAERSGVSFLGDIPLHMAIRQGADAGEPVVISAPHSSYAQAYGAIAQRVKDYLTEIAPSKGRTFSEWLGLKSQKKN